MPNNDPFVLAGREYRSRLIVGSGKYRSFEETRAATEAAGAEIVTVALRRVNITDPAKREPARPPAARPLHDPAQHGRLLHRRRGGAHGAPGARAGVGTPA